jgi:SSS family transporter
MGASEFSRVAVLVPFFGYLAAVFFIAWLSHRHLKNDRSFEDEYYVGSRSFGAWVLAMSWVATMASGGSFLGYPSRIFSYGWSMTLWVSGSCVAAIVGLGVIGKRINRLARQTGALTLVDILRDRFQSRAIGTIYPILIVFMTSVYLLAQFVAGATILENMLGMSYVTGLILFSVCVVAYTTYGGFRAVAWTDTMQGIVMIVGIVLLVPFAIHAAGGLTQATTALSVRVDPVAEVRGIPPVKHAYLYGPGPLKVPNNIEELQKRAAETPRKQAANETYIGEPGGGSEEDLSWLPWSMGISFFMLRSLAAMMMPTTVPRMLAFKDTRALRRALYLLAPYLLLMYVSSLIAMNCATQIDLGLAPHEADQAIPELAKKVAPWWLAGLIIAAPFAAVMSTVDSGLLVVSASIVRDLLQKNMRTRMEPRTTRRLSYGVTAGIGIVAFGMALTKPPFLQPLIIYYAGGAAASLFWPSIVTLFWRRATSTGVLAGLLGGAACFVLFNEYRPFDSLLPVHPFVYGFAMSGILTYLFCLLTPAQDDSQVELYFGRPPSDD